MSHSTDTLHTWSCDHCPATAQFYAESPHLPTDWIALGPEDHACPDCAPMIAGQSMLNLAGWRMIPCEERNLLARDGLLLHVTSSVIDHGLDGVIYTEWGLDGRAVLRDYHWLDRLDVPCQHWVPGGDA